MSVTEQPPTTEWQQTKMRVGAEILKNLSKGIYSNPANTIKELINNSYDADATEVIIRARPEYDTITITDNGGGMNETEFKEDFTFISRSRKRDIGLYTKTLNRPIIGKIGIGFISALQICDEMTFISSKKGENIKLEAKIDFGKFKGKTARKAKFQDISDVLYRNVPEDSDAHYTMIIMRKLSEAFIDILTDKELKGIQTIDFKGITFEEVIDQIEKAVGQRKLEDLSKAKHGKRMGEYWNMVLHIANAVPVPYLKDGPIRDPTRFKIIEEVREKAKSLKFDVDLDGVHLKKPLRFPNVQEVSKEKVDYDVFTFKERFRFDDGSTLSFKGYVYNQRMRILPTQFRGLIIRIKNVAIGGFSPDFLKYPYAEKLWLPWTSGEIFIDDGLEEAMNIDRNTFDVTHPHYRKLRNYLHTLLHEKIFRRVRARYVTRMDEKRELELKEKKRLRKNLFRRIFGTPFAIKYSTKFKPDYPIDIDVDRKVLTIHKFHEAFAKSKQKRDFLEDTLILFEIGYYLSGGNVEKLKKFFIDEIKRW